MADMRTYLRMVADSPPPRRPRSPPPGTPGFVRSVARKIFADNPERWSIRCQQQQPQVAASAADEAEEGNPPATKKPKKEQEGDRTASSPSSSLLHLNDLDDDVLADITSFLDPLDMRNWFSACTVTRSLSEKNDIWQIRLQSVFGYFRATKEVADVWRKHYDDPKRLIQFLEYVAYKMQAVYGRELTVHPVHRALFVNFKVLNAYNAVPREPPDDLDGQDLADWEDERRHNCQPHPLGEDRQAWERHLFTSNHGRFTWEIVFGDRYYSVDEYSWNVDDLRDETMKVDVLYRGSIWIYLYQDEDNYDTVGINIGDDKEVTVEGGTFCSRGGDYDGDNADSSDSDDSGTDPKSFSGLAHYYVMGHRAGPFAREREPTPEQLVSRMAFLYRLRLPPFDGRPGNDVPAMDWDLLFESCGMDVKSSREKLLDDAGKSLANAPDYNVKAWLSLGGKSKEQRTRVS